jgi:outer membrane protein assembly factor BamB
VLFPKLNHIEVGERIRLLRKTVSGILFVLLLASTLTATFNVRPFSLKASLREESGQARGVDSFARAGSTNLTSSAPIRQLAFTPGNADEQALFNVLRARYDDANAPQSVIDIIRSYGGEQSYPLTLQDGPTLRTATIKYTLKLGHWNTTAKPPDPPADHADCDGFITYTITKEVKTPPPVVTIEFEVKFNCGKMHSIDPFDSILCDGIFYHEMLHAWITVHIDKRLDRDSLLNFFKGKGFVVSTEDEEHKIMRDEHFQYDYIMNLARKAGYIALDYTYLPAKGKPKKDGSWSMAIPRDVQTRLTDKLKVNPNFKWYTEGEALCSNVYPTSINVDSSGKVTGKLIDPSKPGWAGIIIEPPGQIIIFEADISTLFSTPDQWPMFHHDLTHAGYSTSTAPDTNRTAWTYKTEYTGTDSSPAVADGMLYIGAGDGVYALRESNGQLMWKAAIGVVDSSPAIANGIVFASYEYGNVYALNATTGAQIWNYPTGEVHSSPTVSDGIVFISSLDGMVYALNSTTGALIWSYRIAPPWAGGFTYFIYSSPAADDGKLYVGSWDDNVYCLNATTGSLIWTYLTGGIVLSSPAVAYGMVFVGSNDGNVYALDGITGTLIGTYSTAATIGSSPAIADGMVFVGTLGGAYNVYALNMTTGTLVWGYNTGGVVWSSLAYADGKVYLGSEDDRIYCLNATIGTLIWSYATGGWVLSSPAVADGVVFVGSWDGKIYAFAVHDVAVTNVASSKTVVGQGFSAFINVTVANQGGYTETFNVTAYCNLTGYTQPPGLVGYWKLDEGSGTTAYDSSGYNNNGIIYGASWTSGKVNSALSFDGVDDYVDCGNDSSLMPTTAITVEAWFKANDVRYGAIASTVYYEGYGLYIEPDGSMVFFPGISYSPPGIIQPGVWYHVVGTFDGTSKSKLYVNGKLVGSQGTGYLAYTGQRLSIGTNPTRTGWFNGIIDEVKIYNRSLSAEEIWAEYTRTGGIQTQSVTLEAGASAPVTFTWNTTGFAKGNYTIWAYAEPCPDEIDTSDNTRVDGFIWIGVPCDVTGPTQGVPDGICNMRDIGYICSKFGTTLSSPNWNPNCDITGPTKGVPDGIVNMRDIGLACNNFMKTDP